MSRNRPRLNVTAIVGLCVVVLAAILMGAVIVASQPSTQIIYTPKANVPAFRTLTDGDLNKVSVKTDEIFADALTPAKVAELRAEGKQVYTVEPLQGGAPILMAQVSNDPVKALQVVSADEQMVGVSTSASGSVAGTLRPGDVVDVFTDGSDSGQSATYAKVIGFGTVKDAGRGVAGVEEPVEGSDGGDIQVILSVAKDSAAGVAGQKVSLSKHPYCVVGATGQITPIDPTQADACAVPAERLAAHAAE